MRRKDGKGAVVDGGNFHGLRHRWVPTVLAMAILCGWVRALQATDKDFIPPPPAKNVTISNGPLSVTFNLAWGAVVVGITNKNVAHGLNIVDYHDVGRLFQVDQFLFFGAKGRKERQINPTQAGHRGYNGFPNGLVLAQKGSPVVHWWRHQHEFHAVIKPFGYNHGQLSHWKYVEDVRIDKQGVAHFKYTFYSHERITQRMNAEIPTLYSDRTDAFMFPRICPFKNSSTARRDARTGRWPVKLLRPAPSWPQPGIRSKGWIANIDTADHLGIFYTTPVGLTEAYGTFPGAGVSDRPPLGKTNVAALGLISYPGEIFSVKFSALVARPKNGPVLISRQQPAVFRIIHNVAPKLPHP